jgi:hypothetical protein
MRSPSFTRAREVQYVYVGSYQDAATLHLHLVTALLPAGEADVVVFIAREHPPRQRFTLDDPVFTFVTRG